MANEIKLADVGDEESFDVGARWTPFDFASKALSKSWRLATNRVRHMPTTVIVGAQRAGTTQLFAHMVRHPRCYGAAELGVDFFSAHSERSRSWYRAQFPWRRRVSWRQGHVLEASSSYLATPSALRKMRAVIPNARMVAILRDPVSRAFSHYQHEKARGVESRSFAEAVEAEIRRNAFPAQWGVALRDGVPPMSGYVARGYYALQLELLNKVYRRNRLLVLDSESLFTDTAAACNRVFDYMGLEDFDVAPVDVYGRGFHRQVIDPRVASRLREHYRPYDEMLQEWLGQSFGWMAPQVLSMVG